MLVALLPLLSSWQLPTAGWSAAAPYGRLYGSAYASGSSTGAPISTGTTATSTCARYMYTTCSRTVAPVMGGRRPRQAPQKVVDNTPINERIQFDEMRVTVDVPGEADEMLGVMSKADALAEAQRRDLDLVLIAAKSDPPVCKIVSYDKFRYAKEKKKKEQKAAASKGQELKELKMSYKIGEHDYEVRKKQAIRFLKQGNKVKFSMLFRGREITHADVGQKLMLEMATSLEDIGVLDGNPKIMGRQMIMMISPKATI